MTLTLICSRTSGESNRWLRLKLLRNGESHCVAVKALLTQLKALRGGERDENDDENENKASRTKQKLLGSEDAD